MIKRLSFSISLIVFSFISYSQKKGDTIIIKDEARIRTAPDYRSKAYQIVSGSKVIIIEDTDETYFKVKTLVQGYIGYVNKVFMGIKVQTKTISQIKNSNSNYPGKIFKFRTTESVLVDNNFKTTKLNGIAYHTFDFDKRLITLRTIDNTGTHLFNFKMISSSLKGDFYSVKVTSNDFQGINEISFNPNLPFIWFDGINGTITYGGLTTIE